MFQGNLLSTNFIGINKINLPNKISEDFNKKWKIYPNPFTDQIWIERNGSQLETLTLSDITGREIRQFELEGKLCTIALENILPGIYFLRSETGFSWKIIKR